MARLPAVASQLRRQLIEERHFVFRARVHEEEERVHALPPACRRPVKHRDLDVHRHGHDLVRELREQGGESEKKGLPARRALGANHEVALVEQARHGGGVGVAAPREADRADRREDLREPADGVGHRGDLPAHGDGEEDRVKERAVRADEEDSALLAADRTRRGDAADAHSDAEYRFQRERPPHRQHDADEYAHHREKEPDRAPQHHHERHERRRAAHEPPVMEDQGFQKLSFRHRGDFLVRRYEVAFFTERHEWEVARAVAKADIRGFRAEILLHGELFIGADEHAARRDEAGGVATRRERKLRAHDGVDGEILFEERLHHDARVCRHDVTAPAGGEDFVGDGVHVLKVKFREDTARDGLDDGFVEAREGEEDEHLDAGGFREEDVDEVDEGRDEEEDDGAKRAPGLEGEQHEVGEGAPRAQERAVQIGDDAVVRAGVHSAAFDLRTIVVVTVVHDLRETRCGFLHGRRLPQRRRPLPAIHRHKSNC